VVADGRLETCGIRLIVRDRCRLPAKVNGMKNFHYSSLINFHFIIISSTEPVNQVPSTFPHILINELQTAKLHKWIHELKQLHECEITKDLENNQLTISHFDVRNVGGKALSGRVHVCTISVCLF
jgi:hypothetical protein